MDRRLKSPAILTYLAWVAAGLSATYLFRRLPKRAARPLSAVPREPAQTSGEYVRDRVEESSWESFPASDPPSTY